MRAGPLPNPLAAPTIARSNRGIAMHLIGMLDSPYVRRVAVSLKLLGMPYEHSLLSVFRNFGEFAAINPVVKAPTLVTDDGAVLMDSSLILQHIEQQAPRSLMPAGPAHTKALRLIGLGLAACEKNVQIVYEQNLRPADKQHQPWLDRVGGQLLAAYAALEAEAALVTGWLTGDEILQPDITVAVAWRFTQSTLPDMVRADAHPGLAALTARAEELPAFRETYMDFKT
jgi:glutathione S-transferase